MNQRRIVTPAAGILALALGIALFYVVAGPGARDASGPAEGVATAPAVDGGRPLKAQTARQASVNEPPGEFADEHPGDDLPTHNPMPGAERSFGEVVTFVVRERCDDAGNCRLTPVALHEYEDYSIDELKAIARFDGEAAIVLASKLGGGDFKEARKWALRAFVMTKDPYAYHMAANFSGVAIGEGFVNDEFDRSAAERAYVWMKTGYLLGVNDGTDLTQQEMILDRHGFEDRERLDRQVSAGVAYLTQKRLELTGEGF